MESYADFMERIAQFEKPDFHIGNGYFSPSTSLLQKVTETNTFAKFYGDTVVFELGDKDLTTINSLIDIIYRRASECFCERFNHSTPHLTLHDLSSGPNINEIRDKLDSNLDKACNLLLGGRILPGYIKMKSNYIINMVNTSLVLCFYPADEKQYKRIMGLYSVFDDFVQLSYPFTPHITLAYFNRNGFSSDDAKKLEAIVNRVNMFPIEIMLDTRKLFYQRFNSMNEFLRVLTFCRTS